MISLAVVFGDSLSVCIVQSAFEYRYWRFDFSFKTESDDKSSLIIGRISEEASCFNRLIIVSTLASKHIVKPQLAITDWFLLSVNIPPPVDIIKFSPFTVSTSFLCSRFLNVDSPWLAKIWLIS